MRLPGARSEPAPAWGRSFCWWQASRLASSPLSPVRPARRPHSTPALSDYFAPVQGHPLPTRW